MKRFVFILLLLLSLHLKVFSCSCVIKPNFKESVKIAKYIFSGIVISEEIVCYESTDTGWNLITYEDTKQKEIVYYYRRLKLELVENYKGNFESKIVFVETPIGKTMCEFFFE
jgi:hypothetical protein